MKPSDELRRRRIDLQQRIRGLELQLQCALERVQSENLEADRRKQIERELQVERNRLKGILDNMEDGVCVIGAQHEIEYANSALQRDFGPVDGRKCYQYLHNSEVVCPSCRNSDVFAGKSVHWEQRFDNGRTYELFDTPFCNVDGTVSVLEIVHDTTEHKRAEEALRDSENKLRSLSFELLAAQETERRRISKELHDGLGQSLTVMKLRLGLIKRSLLPSQEEIKQECDTTLRYIDQVIENTRRMSRDLSPSILEDLGLGAAIRRLTEEFVKGRELSYALDIDRIDDLFPEKSRIVLYRIFQEALTNVEKHAEATKVCVTVRREYGRVRFELEDDGKGFDCVKALAMETGLGLATINERVRMLGGTLQLQSRPGNGTRIRFTLPCADEL